MIGQDIATLLPTLLTDLLFAEKAEAPEIVLAEKNPAMAELLTGYGEAILRKAGRGGSIRAEQETGDALAGADCILYAGDCQPASRFAMDRNALGNDEDEDAGLSDQARVNGGIGGLLHALRAGSLIHDLCDGMDLKCPGAIVINLGQPMARTTAVFLERGYRCFGLGRTPLKGANGLDNILKRMQISPDRAKAMIAGLPGFAFLLSLQDGKADLLPKLKKAVRNNEMGSLSRRWLDWWDAVAVGDVTDHAEFLPAQPDFIPEEHPEFGESVERRKERILYMNTVREQGASAREGAMAQLLLLSKAPPIRPMRLAVALMRKETAELPAVTRQNGGNIPGLPRTAVIEAPLRLEGGAEAPLGLQMPPALLEIMAEIDEANRLAAKASGGDRSALRACVEEDPALGGLDRLYCQELTESLIRMHQDVLPRLQ